jgi:protein-tyrosine-phosphatase
VTPGEPLRVLFLCTGNSARSQMAEAILRHLAGDRVAVESAGSDPRPEIHPMAREAIRSLFGLEMEGQHPKSVGGFSGPPFDAVITVCDRAAESCPVFPGAPELIRWSLPDPAAAAGGREAQRLAFENSAKELMRRIRSWLALPAVARRIPAADRA